MKLIQKAHRYYHTLKYLQPAQILRQLTFRLKKSRVRITKAPPLRRPMASWSTHWVRPIAKTAQLIRPTQIKLLNQERNIAAASIWADPLIDKLWLYNLHYFDVLNAAPSANNLPWLIHLMQRWIRENPIPAVNAWEPYTISLRIVNWIKWLLATQYEDQVIHQSLATQIRFLLQNLETHILGNHLLANAKALIFAGCYFEGKEADKWYATGMQYFKAELKEQILADGGHFELSPMYHAIILEDLLDVTNVLSAFGKSFPATWTALANKMFDWLHTMSHLDDDSAFFNDTTLGVAPTRQALLSYHARLKMPPPQLPNLPFTHLDASGFARLQQNIAVLIADVGHVGAAYQPGHAHADTLSFELSLGAQRLLINSGISTYNDNAERHWQRSTAAHNTVVINDKNSSDVWKSFRVAERASVKNIKSTQAPNHLALSAEHDGYYKKFKIIHRRAWDLTPNKLFIHDSIEGVNIHKVAVVFHVHPDIHLEKNEDDNIVFYDLFNKPLAVLSSTHKVAIMESTYHPEFNLSIANKKIVIETTTVLPTHIKTFITWNS
jgi:uncharacterized heparinase superfamily protein